jgi:peptidoglycan biosynthesis protein MviN/MurJ (putative lipid II flippase)
VIAGLALDGTIIIVGAGLYIQKQTKKLMGIVIACAVTNLLLNLALVPVLGILGSAVSTLVSYALLAFAAGWLSRQLLPKVVPWGSLAKFSFLALIMYLAIFSIDLGTAWLTMLVKMGLGVVVYGILVLAFDPVVREALANSVERYRTK